MPGKGRVDMRAYTPDELAAIRSGASALGFTEEQTVACLGATSSDVYLNNTAYWRNVPAKYLDRIIFILPPEHLWASSRKTAN